MANAEAWNAGWALGHERAEHSREHKEALADEARRQNVQDLHEQMYAIRDKAGLSNDDRLQALTQIEQKLEQIYHPVNAPGALQKDWDFIKGLITRKKALPSTTSVSPDMTITPPAQPVTMAAVPAQGVSGASAAGPETPEQQIALPSQPITIPGSKTTVGLAAKPTRYENRMQAQQDRAQQAAELVAMGAPPSPEEDAEQEHRKTLAYFSDAMKNWKMLNPKATPEQEAQASAELWNKKYSIPEKPVWKEFVSQDGKSKTYFDVTKSIPPGWNATGGGASAGNLKFDNATGQIFDPATRQRYTNGDPSNPPEVARMFLSANMFLAQKQAFQEQMMKLRGESYGSARQMAPLSVLDTSDGNRPTFATYQEMMKSPGRFLPAGEADKALARENLMQDIMGTSILTRKAINGLKEDFPLEMKGKILLAMRADDPHASLDQLLASGALGTLSDDQWQFLVTTRQLAENAMAMRSILGAGQGSDDVRSAIRDTLPGLLTPDRNKALTQLDAFDKTIARLHRGVPKVPLRTDIGGGEGGAQAKKPKHSLSKAMTLPFNKGKSEAQVRADLEAHNYEVIP